MITMNDMHDDKCMKQNTHHDLKFSTHVHAYWIDVEWFDLSRQTHMHNKNMNTTIDYVDVNLNFLSVIVFLEK